MTVSVCGVRPDLRPAGCSASLARRRRAGAAQHGRLPLRPRGGADRRAGPRGARHELGQARGDRRRDARLLPDAVELLEAAETLVGRRLHRAALHDRRPGAGPAAGRRRLRGGDAARVADRLRAGRPQPARDRGGARRGRRPGRARRRHRHRQRRGAARWSWAATPCWPPPRSPAPTTRSRWPARCGSAVEAGLAARQAGRIPRRTTARASSPTAGTDRDDRLPRLLLLTDRVAARRSGAALVGRSRECVDGRARGRRRARARPRPGRPARALVAELAAIAGADRDLVAHPRRRRRTAMHLAAPTSRLAGDGWWGRSCHSRDAGRAGGRPRARRT